MILQSVVEPQISDTNRTPDDQGADCTEVTDPEENIDRVRTDIQIDEKTKCRGDANASIGHTKLLEAKESGSFPIECCCIKNSS